jgi:UDP-N-acetyl-2-amino-2-deoxyglucuronate dehydrogenase
MAKVKFAILGCGRIAFKHLEAIEANADESEIVAVCDTIESKAKEYGEKLGVPFYTSLTEMLKQDNIEIVSLCTPSGLHPEHGIEVAKSGRHVLTEKPMGTSYQKARNLIDTCDANDVQLHVVHQNRLNTTIDTLKSAIDKNRFGRIYSIQVNVFWTRPQEYYDAAKWRGTWEFDGGCFMNQASHYIDLIDYLVGDVDSVMCYTSTMERKIEAEDTGVACFKFRNGALGTLNVTMLTYPKNLEGSITILGEKGTVRIGGVAVNKVDEWTFDSYDDDDKLVQEASYDTASVYGFGHTGYYKNVIQAIQTGERPPVCGRQGLKSLELILALYKSAKENKRVPLPLEM